MDEIKDTKYDVDYISSENTVKVIRTQTLSVRVNVAEVTADHTTFYEVLSASMATAKANKKMAAVAMALPECPVCLEVMSAPIYQCQSGHSLCSNCSKALCPSICPICRQPMTQTRNWQLEEIVEKAVVACPNKSSGCVYTMPKLEVENHLSECIFREMVCPLNVFGKCSWKGKLTNMMEHFKERHSTNCNVSSDSDIELTNVSVDEDDRHVWLVNQAKFHFILTMKIDTIQKMAYWTVQHIGSRTVALQHMYEIHLPSKQDSRRKVVFIEHCFNDAMKADEVFRQAKCAVLPLDMLRHFIKGKQLSFRFYIKRIPFVPKNKGDNDDGKGENKPPNKGPKGPGPNSAGPKGPGPKKFNKQHV